MLLATKVNAVYRNMDVARNKLHFAESSFYFFSLLLLFRFMTMCTSQRSTSYKETNKQTFDINALQLLYFPSRDRRYTLNTEPCGRREQGSDGSSNYSFF